ncbi:hypothetical protein KP509_08G067300 [Ceratopteris richardii]|uniref:Structural maintenance of chromosomes protein n=3 Tax=Ceratopteris richardii TaxID=49495 RepID=A0A8T2UD46_CERRI|nr:hypothetical protein KP509_08G067300 [Ceratopteris richardii]
MYIKQVIIEGFKSYKEQVETEPFSPRHNCVVGANGSGKTNFFHAIRFVLSDLFHNLRAEDRRALLHEGAGHQVLSAFVEIVFDNSDNRIPVDRDEVRLRRTIGLKKDEYYLDKKHITKTEVMNLLESAGFSRSNPYYVVQQGKIASLTLMKDSERLDLLKEIGGTRVYEERRKESLKIMQDAENRRKQIIEVVHYIEERLKELDEEREELKKYQELDRQRRSLEYTIFEKELLDTRQKLDEIEDARAKVSEKSTAMYNNILESHERLKTTDKDLKKINKDLQLLVKDREITERERTEAIESATKIELDVQEIEEKIRTEAKSKEEITEELKALDTEVQRCNKELDKLKPLYDRQLLEEEEISNRIVEQEKRLSLLYQKQGHATQFEDKDARDKWLQAEINQLNSALAKNLSLVEKLDKEIQQLDEDASKLSQNEDTRSKECQELKAVMEKCHEDSLALKAKRDELQEARKKLWEQETDATNEVDKLKIDIMKAEKSLDRSAPGDLRRGLNSVRRICKDHNITGVHGPLCELLDCDEKFFTAIEVTAGNSLFHVVVDNDEISTKIIRYLSAEKGGRVTFIPLNRVKAPQVNYPASPDVVPLLKKLNFSSSFSQAFAQVFGRTVICRDLDVATNVARTAELDCITLDGDQVSKKGGMTGGFYDYRRSKLKLINTIRECTNAVNDKYDELKRVKISLLDADQKITVIVSEQQKLDAKLGHHKSELDQLKQDLTDTKKQKFSVVKAHEKKRKLLANARSQIQKLELSLKAKEAEMGTELIDQLSSDERALLSALNPEIMELKETLVKCRTSRIETEARKSELESALSTNLVKRQQELEAQLSVIDPDALKVDLKEKLVELESAKVSVVDATRHLKAITDQAEKLRKQINELKGLKDEFKMLENEYEKTLQDEKNDLEQLFNRKNLLQAKREDIMKKIRDLGSLPSDAFEKYQRKGLKELHKLLHNCNKQLKKFSHVNKKALDQYINFTEQREELHRRQAEIDDGDEKIKELISVLDKRKDESIERTFKSVAKNFKESFAELVAGGHGSLVMMKKRKGDEVDNEDVDEDVDHNAENEGRVEKYIGVKVKVSFTGEGETQSMKQLSGGQKTVVALALIFAIQRCDPGPFYLFDEIDAALDPQYRTAVSNMIQRQAETTDTQFITTTFRPELVKVADKVYGVFHKNRVSRVAVISREDALYFIEQDQSHQND